MGAKYDLEPYRSPDRQELKDTRYPSYHPKYNTGMYIERFGGWRWVTTDGTEYRTDAEGCGLFRWNGQDWKQLTGTLQYSLPSNRQKALRKLQRDGYDIQKI